MAHATRIILYMEIFYHLISKAWNFDWIEVAHFINLIKEQRYMYLVGGGCIVLVTGLFLLAGIKMIRENLL